MLNINEFKKHLHNIHNTLDDPSMNNQMRDRLSEQGPVCNMKEYKPDQKVDKSTDKPTTGAMDTLRPNSKSAERGGTVKEGAADASAAGGKKPKKAKAIVVEEEEDEIHPSVLEYFENYFGDTLNEDTSDEDIMDAVEALVELRDAVCEAVGLKKNLTVDEAIIKPKNFVMPSTSGNASIERGSGASDLLYGTKKRIPTTWVPKKYADSTTKIRTLKPSKKGSLKLTQSGKKRVEGEPLDPLLMPIVGPGQADHHL